MRFAVDLFHFPGLLFVVGAIVLVGGFAALLIFGSSLRARAEARFGDPKLVRELRSHDPTERRAIKGVLVVLGVALFLAAFARPQFSRGTRLIPATNLDVVIVLDYSKSMYARDIAPSRIARAKAEVSRLISLLPGARFGAVAFAGEPMEFPMTSDGATIAQFFRQLEPNNMPIGGTATARALNSAKAIFERDPKSKDHVRVVVLITDGEDLEGDPVSVAKTIGARIDVVQIGARTAEVIPEVGEDGKVTGIRRDETGAPLTTALSSEGEKQLAELATITGGNIVRSEGGETGIDRIAEGLSKMMREELAERPEVVYAEEYMWPLAIGILLLVVEAMFAEVPVRKRAKKKAGA